MGKIVKSGNISGEKYLVAIPHIEAVAERAAKATELDERFAAPFAMEPGVAEHTNGHSLIEAPEALPVEPQIDWDALRADADAIIDRAAADAQKMIKQAEAAAAEMLADAQARAATLEEEARTSGYDAGFETGKAAADAEMNEMTTTLHSVLESLRDERHGLMESAEPELLRLAMAIAERIVHEQISFDPNVVVENVRAALTRLVSREVVTLRVNPADLETMRSHRDAIVAVSDVEHLRIVEDQRVDRGGVVVETDAGTIDAKIATQLREARRAIRADDGIALGPSFDNHVLHASAQAS